MTALSIRDAWHALDPLNADPISVRGLGERLRWVGTQPGTLPPTGTTSVRLMLERVLRPAEELEFLHFNTWLINPGFQLRDLVLVVGSIAELAEMALIGPAELAAELLERLGSAAVCDLLFPDVSACGVELDPANFVCKQIGNVAELAAWALDKLAGGLDELIDLLEVGLDFALDVLLFMIGGSAAQVVNVKNAPQIGERAAEIGRSIAGYDVASLCEVWEPDSQQTLTEQVWSGGGAPDGHTAVGPQLDTGNPVKHMGSGLLAVTPRRPCTRVAATVYRPDGVSREGFPGKEVGAAVDSDRWADKGAMLTRIATAGGTVDLYTTHLYSGGDPPLAWFFDLIGHGIPPVTDEEKRTIRLDQCRALAAFVAATHDPAAVAVIAGDFNLDGADAVVRQQLSDVFGEIALADGTSSVFDDAYLGMGFAPPSPDPFDTSGGTNRVGDQHGDFPACHPRPAPPRPGEQLNRRDYWCLDEDPRDRGQRERIDFILVERPRPGHRIDLSLTRLRRRAFRRDVPDAETDYLSDHVGLETTLLVRTGPPPPATF